MEYQFFVNTQTDEKGRRIGLVDGYQNGHQLTLAWVGKANKANPTARELENLYRIFNLDRPTLYRGPSMSKGDVVVLKDEEGDRAYAVASIGFERIGGIDGPIVEMEQAPWAQPELALKGGN